MSSTLELMNRIAGEKQTDTLSLMDKIAGESKPETQGYPRRLTGPDIGVPQDEMPPASSERQPPRVDEPSPPSLARGTLREMRDELPPVQRGFPRRLTGPDVGPPPNPLNAIQPQDIARMAFDNTEEWQSFSPEEQQYLIDRVKRHQLGREVKQYEEENPALTRLGQRLQAGGYNLAQSIQGTASVNYGDILNAFDAIDQGAPVQSIGPQGPNKAMERQSDPVWNAALMYHRASPEQRAQMRAGVEQSYNEATGGVAKYASKSAEVPRNPAAVAAIQADSFEGFWNNFTIDPVGVLAQIGVESAPNMIPSIALGTAGGVVAGPAGFASGIGSGSALTEFGMSIADKLQELGADLSDPESVQKVLREHSKEIRTFAGTRAAVIGAFDAASGGLAAMRLIPRGGVGRNIAEAGTQLAAQAGLGAGGEAAGQYAAGQEFKPGEIAAEGIGELTTGPAEVGGAMISGARGNASRSPSEARTAPLEKSTPNTENIPTPTQPPETATAEPSAPNVPTEPEPSPPNVPEPKAGAPIAVVVDGSEYDPGGPAPTAPADPSRSGTLGKAVARTAGQLERILREADARRNEPQLTPEQKKAANQVKTDVLNALDEIQMKVEQSQYGNMVATARMEAEQWIPNARKSDWEKEREHYVRGFTDAATGSVAAAMESNIPSYRVGVREGKKYLDNRGAVKPQGVHLGIVRVTGSKATFNLPADPEAIANLRKRISKMADERFYSQDPRQQTLAMMDRVQGMAPPGENYRGMVADRVEGVRRETPLRREDILRDFVTGIGMPIYQGRIKKGKMLGYFRPSISEVRIKRMNDIEVASHEMAHLLDKHFPEIRKKWLPATKANETIRAELRGVSYDRSKLYEGFAEFVRLWMTQPDEAAGRAPNFFAWWEDYLTGHQHEKTLRKAQQEMTAWFAQDAVTRARSKIGVTKGINTGLDSIFDRFRQSVADDLHGIYQMEREMTGQINPVGPYEKARTSRAAFSIAEGALRYGALKVNPDGSHSYAGKGLEEILAPVGERLDDFLLYAVGRSAGELMSQGRENLFTKAEIRGVLALETPEFVQAFEAYQGWNNAIVDFAQAKGLINPAFRRTWKRSQYLPFHRVGQPGPFQSQTGDWKGIRALTGGTDNIRDVLGNMIGNAVSLIQASLINEARVEVANLARQDKGARWMVKLAKDEKAVKIHREEIRRKILESLGVKRMESLPVEIQVVIDQMIDGMEPMTALMMRGQKPPGHNVITVLRNGEEEYYEVADPVLYRALTSLKRKHRNMVLKFFSSTRRFVQGTITLAIGFIAKNAFRDTLMATVMSRHGFRPAIDSAKGFASRVRTDQSYKDYIANGGGLSSYLIDEDHYRAHLEKFYRKKGINTDTILHTGSELLFAYMQIAEAVEMSARLGEYRRAVKKGAHPRHAAYSGREVSTDYAMRGDAEYLQYAYDGILFLKAAMNSVDRLYRGISHDPNKMKIGVMTGLIATFSIGLHALNAGNPEYDDLPDWERDAFWNFFIPTEAMLKFNAGLGPEPKEGERYHHFRLPKIWEIGAISSVAERGYEAATTGEYGELPEDVRRITVDQFNLGFIPAFLEPAYEAFYTNRESYTGAPVEPERIRDLPPYMRSTAGTSETARRLGEAQKDLPRSMQLSPAQIEHLIEGYFNAFGSYGLTLADAYLFDSAPDMSPNDYPLIGTFYRTGPQRQTKSQEQFYEFLREATEARSAITDLAFRWRMDEADAAAQNLMAQLQPYLSAQQQAVGALRKLRDRAMYAPDLVSLHKLIDETMANNSVFRDDIERLRKTKKWSDAGALKAEIRDIIMRVRNDVFRRAVKDVEERRP